MTIFQKSLKTLSLVFASIGVCFPITYWQHAGAESFLYVANLCQRSISGFRIDGDGSLLQVPGFPLPSVAHRLMGHSTLPVLYAANIGTPGNQTRAYRANPNGFLEELTTLNMPAWASALTMHVAGHKFYRANTAYHEASYGFFIDPDVCMVEASFNGGRDGLSTVNLLKSGDLADADARLTETGIRALAADPQGEFLFAGSADPNGRQGRFETYRLDQDGLVIHPPAHILPHDFASHFLLILSIGGQRYLLSADGDPQNAYGFTLFRINPDGSLTVEGDPFDTGYDLREIAVTPLKSGEFILYLAHGGNSGEKGSNNVRVLRLEKGPRIVPLQTLPMPPGFGDPFYRQPSGVIASPTHLYVTNFGFNDRPTGVGLGSILVFGIREDGTLEPEPLQEIESGGNGAARPVILTR